MPNMLNGDSLRAVVNLIYHTVITDTYPELLIRSSQPDCLVGYGSFLQRYNLFQNTQESRF